MQVQAKCPHPSDERIQADEFGQQLHKLIKHRQHKLGYVPDKDDHTIIQLVAYLLVQLSWPVDKAE